MADDKKAQEIIALRDREKAKQSNFRSLWQETADLIYPRQNQIVNKQIPGQPKTQEIHDVTAMTESQNMASGLSSYMVQPGREFFGLRASRKELNDIEIVRHYLSMITEQVHEALYASNFLLELNETLRSLVTFGTNNLYSEWTVKTGLNFRDHDIGSYQVLENSEGRVDTNIMTLPMTARQAIQEFGEDAFEENSHVLKAFNEEDDKENTFNFIYLVRPRAEYSPSMIDVLNMPFEVYYVAEEDKKVVKQDGFPEFPYAIARWMKSSSEVYGRGVGTESLPVVRGLQQMKKDFLESANKWNNPPKEVLESYNGVVDETPNALNFVVEIPSIKAIDQGTRGAMPITKDVLEGEREIVREAFFKPTFEQLASLGKGDRRTTVEIIERLKEGMKKLSNPIGRILAELLTPLITRSVLLLMRNGAIPSPPAQLQGQKFKIEYIGPLALALKDQHVRAFDYWLDLATRMEVLFPGAKDNIDSDEAMRDIGDFLGVKESHRRGVRERDAIREQRQAELDRQREMEMAAMMAQGYGQTTKTPESGSAAEQLQEAVS